MLEGVKMVRALGGDGEGFVDFPVVKYITEIGGVEIVDMCIYHRDARRRL